MEHFLAEFHIDLLRKYEYTYTVGYHLYIEGKMNRYVNVEIMAKRWHISVRQIQIPCQNGKIEGASKLGNAWAIPESVLKPTRSGKRKPERKPRE